VELIELKRAYPYGWHSTFAGGWQRIYSSDLGLASTSTLLDLYKVTGDLRRRLECEPRPESKWLERKGLSRALLRDQKPLLPVHLLEHVLEGGGMSVREWCLELNRRVYFFVSEDPLRRLLRAYSDQEHDVIVVDARMLADRYEHAITLSSINTGAIQPAYKDRGRSTFLTIADYPTRASGSPAKPVAEIAVSEPVGDIAEIAVRVERWRGHEPGPVIWERPTARASPRGEGS
jgi:hypothetical protein